MKREDRQYRNERIKNLLQYGAMAQADRDKMNMTISRTQTSILQDLTCPDGISHSRFIRNDDPKHHELLNHVESTHQDFRRIKRLNVNHTDDPYDQIEMDERLKQQREAIIRMKRKMRTNQDSDIQKYGTLLQDEIQDKLSIQKRNRKLMQRPQLIPPEVSVKFLEPLQMEFGNVEQGIIPVSKAFSSQKFKNDLADIKSRIQTKQKLFELKHQAASPERSHQPYSGPNFCCRSITCQREQFTENLDTKFKEVFLLLEKEVKEMCNSLSEQLQIDFLFKSDKDFNKSLNQIFRIGHSSKFMKMTAILRVLDINELENEPDSSRFKEEVLHISQLGAEGYLKSPTISPSNQTLKQRELGDQFSFKTKTKRGEARPETPEFSLNNTMQHKNRKIKLSKSVGRELSSTISALKHEQSGPSKKFNPSQTSSHSALKKLNDILAMSTSHLSLLQTFDESQLKPTFNTVQQTEKYSNVLKTQTDLKPYSNMKVKLSELLGAKKGSHQKQRQYDIYENVIVRRESLDSNPHFPLLNGISQYENSPLATKEEKKITAIDQQQEIEYLSSGKE
ncbi:hypothetical protein FGO68_gene8000 [Halteria grandinella]|uniref:Uncharacterized protein n=1 Tax=Halteria grandinella TaxID=5974 RepID=A0A8J8NTL4_HALGN|nr:hypothetical protein FGO68_gene8000 [Halteria grandinella]